MSKPAAATVTASNCRLLAGLLCAALSALTLLPLAALAATPDPSLRRSEQLDIRRLGKVSIDERSVLRVEWRAAVSAAEEARNVQEILDSVRRMEGTIGEVKRLIYSIPAGTPAVETEQSETESSNARIVAASVVVVCLVALWSFRRRSSVEAREPISAISKPVAASPPKDAVPVAILSPGRRSVAEDDAATTARTVVGGPPASQPKLVQTAAEVSGNKPSQATSHAIATDPAPAPMPGSGSPPAPGQADAKPSAAGPAGSHTIDFKLEDAAPEEVARENARLQKLQELDRRKDPERHKESNLDPTIELAEIMLSLGLEQGAAQALLEYTEANPRQALHHWLKLLDIYRSSGHRKDFKEAAEKLRQNFNIQAEDWLGANAGESPMLENFTRLSEQIQQTWSRPEECMAYLRHLLEDNREGSRAGFPRPVAEEILLLIEILKLESGAAQTVAT